MCDPVTIMAVTAGAGVLSAYGQYEQGKYQEQVGKNNAIMQNRMAENAMQRGQQEEQRHRMRVAQMKSDQRAAFGASGRDISGSALDIIGDTAQMGELDAMTLRSNAETEAYGHKVAAVNSRAEGKLARQKGKFAAMNTLLTTGSKVGGQWQTQS